MSRRLPAEWEPQDGVLLAWPHEESDWQPILAQVEPVFLAIAREISRRERVLVIAPNRAELYERLRNAGAEMARISIVALPSNDTWTRDFGPISVYERDQPLLLDFGFNGWGLKFAADRDNLASRRLAAAGAFGGTALTTIGLVLEGGSVESDGHGSLLTTSECLLNPNRNPHLSKKELEGHLAELLGIDHFLWLNHGYLAGDDTDSHIDTLARLCPDDTIVYVSCPDDQDEHYEALQAMAAELAACRTRDGRPYRLLPLPWPTARFDEDGNRLPATYANFLILNGAVLVPTYDDASDGLALTVVQQAFPDRQIIGINCLPLIWQHGSLHCITMQLPQGVLP